ncbi:MAG TPA: chromate transporter [Chloroflexota bacterium]|nr:chromate transporter [Chloroflexota bacterium]
MSAAAVEVFLLFAKLGLMSVGGGTALLGEMERESVARGWLTHAQFLQAYAIGNLTPGPGTLFVVPIGYKAAGVPGAVAAAVGFILPTAAIGLAVISLWSRLRRSPWPAAIRDALIPVAIGLTFASAYVIGRATLIDVPTALIALISAAALWRTRIPTPVVILASGVVGAVFLR